MNANRTTRDRLIDALGQDGAIRVCKAYGGVRLYIPMRIHDQHPIRLSLGDTIAEALSREFGGDVLSPVPNDAALLKKQRNAEILRMLSEGVSSEEIGRLFGMSGARVRQIKASAD